MAGSLQRMLSVSRIAERLPANACGVGTGRARCVLISKIRRPWDDVGGCYAQIGLTPWVRVLYLK